MAKAFAWLGEKGALVWVEVEMDELTVLTVENGRFPIETRVFNSGIWNINS